MIEQTPWFLPTAPRSPSPVIPGAWPSSSPTTPLHKRPSTGPASSSLSPQSQTGLSLPHLDHVLNFHQRLSLSLSKQTDTFASSSSLAPFAVSESADIASCTSDRRTVPSDESSLGTYVRHDSTASTSIVDDAVHSHGTTAERHARMEIGNSYFDSCEIHNEEQLILPAPRLCPLPASIDSISPILFASPASSYPVVETPSVGYTSYLHSGSLSWDASSDASINKRDLAHESSCQGSSSPKSLPTYDVSQESHRLSSKETSEICCPSINYTLPMPVTFSPSDRSDVNITFDLDSSPTADWDVSGQESFETQLCSKPQPFQLSQSVHPPNASIGNSPVHPFKETLCARSGVELESTPSTLSSPSFASARPSPILELFRPLHDISTEMDAAEYASAVVSSAWGGVGVPLHISPVGINHPVESISEVHRPGPTPFISDSDSENLARAQLNHGHHLCLQTQHQELYVRETLKAKFSHKVKTFLTYKNHKLEHRTSNNLVNSKMQDHPILSDADQSDALQQHKTITGPQNDHIRTRPDPESRGFFTNLRKLTRSNMEVQTDAAHTPTRSSQRRPPTQLSKIKDKYRLSGFASSSPSSHPSSALSIGPVQQRFKPEIANITRNSESRRDRSSPCDIDETQAALFNANTADFEEKRFGSVEERGVSPRSGLHLSISSTNLVPMPVDEDHTKKRRRFSFSMLSDLTRFSTKQS